MTETLLQSPVGRVAAQHPESLPVLERRGVDYCCGGERTLEEACRRAGADPADVLAEIVRARETSTTEAGADWTRESLTELCDHIERTHHAFLREQLPLVTALADKVVVAHAPGHPELVEVRDEIAALRGELEPHMFKEEQILFPAIRALEQTGPPPDFPFGTVQNPIRMMVGEHDNAGELLGRLRELTKGYRPPADACSAYRSLLESLQRLEADLHAHIHKENNILFPRAIAAEAASRAVSPNA